jgi:hypothetical protein
LSFTNTAFSFTRRTCTAASKTILKEALAAIDTGAPVLWIEQAFAVAAGIILSLDAFHRSIDEREFVEHSQLVTDTITYLQAFSHNKIATRGVRLLSALKHELDGSVRTGGRKRTRSVSESGTLSPPRQRTFDFRNLIRHVSQNLEATESAPSQHYNTPGDMSDGTWDAFMDLLPPHTGFDAQYLFDDFLSNQT